MGIKMKICQINCVYGEGSTGKIVRNLHLSFRKDNIDSIVICSKKNSYTAGDPGVFTIANKINGYLSAVYRRGFGRQFDGAFIQTNRMLRILKKEKPDIVHLHCINGNNINIYRLLKYLAKEKIKIVFTLHAEFPYTGGCGHSYDCLKWLSGCGRCPILKEATQSFMFDGTHHTWKMLNQCYEKIEKDNMVFTAVSPWLASRAQMSPMISRFNIFSVLNPVDSKIYHYSPDNDVFKKYNIPDNKKIILHVTASFNVKTDNLKGAKYVLRLAELYKDTDVQFVVAANHCEIDNLPENITYIGRIENNAELAIVYSMADITLITSKRETFSMVTAESLCCGTPVVGFEAGGPESIALKDYSAFVEYGNIPMLKGKCDCFLRKDADKVHISDMAAKTYDNDVISEQYKKIYGYLR